ncbi:MULTISPECIES: hypothetical protein [Bacillus]|uniref:hypothetical protein n=1 Tax=Bacillus TaxID=1386 RepID=UPI002118DDE4|nr:MULTISPECIES: hypothetical protein [Bacillus]WFA05752.1 hypothetical protein P3X63_02570 [Bacillus sp. HSf4]
MKTENITENGAWSKVKLIGITILLFFCLMTFSVLLDIWQGMNLPEALHNNLTFAILEVGEWVLFYILVVLAEAIDNAMSKRKKQPKK